MAEHEEDTPHYLQPLEREEVWERLMDPLFRDSEETDVGYTNARFSVEELEDSRRPLTDNERLAALENFCHGLRAPYLETFAFLEPEVIVAIYRRFFLRGCVNVERWCVRLRAARVEPILPSLPDGPSRLVDSFVDIGRLLDNWLNTVVNHGVVHVPPDPPQTFGTHTGGRREAYETVVLLSVPAVSGGRVVVAVGSGDANVCQVGCWCASVRTLTVVAVAPGAAPATIVSLSWGAREAEGDECHRCFDVAPLSGGDSPTVLENSIRPIEAALPVVRGDVLAALVRFAVLAANIEGKGREHWARIARGSRFGGGDDWGEEEEDEDEDGRGSYNDDDTVGEAEDDAGTASAAARAGAGTPFHRLMMGITDRQFRTAPETEWCDDLDWYKSPPSARTGVRSAVMHPAPDSACGALLHTRALLADEPDGPSLEALDVALDGPDGADEPGSWQARVLAAVREGSPRYFEVERYY